MMIALMNDVVIVRVPAGPSHGTESILMIFTKK